MDGEGLLNEELPNCWECPKCYQEDNSEKAQVRELYLDLHWEERKHQAKEVAVCLPLQLYSCVFSDPGEYFFPLVNYFFLLFEFFMFCFCVTEHCSTWGLQMAEVHIHPEALGKETITGLLEEGNEVSSIVPLELNLRGGSDLRQLVKRWCAGVSSQAASQFHFFPPLCLTESLPIGPNVSCRGSPLPQGRPVP